MQENLQNRETIQKYAGKPAKKREFTGKNVEKPCKGNNKYDRVGY